MGTEITSFRIHIIQLRFYTQVNIKREIPGGSSGSRHKLLYRFKCIGLVIRMGNVFFKVNIEKRFGVKRAIRWLIS